METTGNEAVAPIASGEAAALPLQFTGNGVEYFGIWIVNLVLTIVTVGIYSAWAKVRRLQYFYRNTQLAGSSFDYHGNPRAILKGKLIAFGLFILYSASARLNPVIGLLVFILLAAVMPWLIMRSLRFKLYNSSYRGLRFRFHGSTPGAYKVFLLQPFLTVITLYLLAPFWHRSMKSYQHNNSSYGQTAFSFDARTKSFYKIYGIAVLMFLIVFLIVGAVVVAAFSGVFVSLFTAPQEGGDSKARVAAMILPLLVAYGAFILAALFVGPYVMARIQNLVWNHTSLGAHRFVSNLSARKLFFIVVTNFIGIVLTLGLFKPFAAVRMLRYRLQSLSLVPAGSLETFIAGQEQQLGAAGEETAEMFDFDISL